MNVVDYFVLPEMPNLGTGEFMSAPMQQIRVTQPDWLIFQRFFEAVGGVGNYLLLRTESPSLCREMMEAFGITVEDLPKKEAA